MKKRLTVIYGQAPELSTSFQTRELTRHLANWFEIEALELPGNQSGLRYQSSRFWRNYISPALQRPSSDFILYGNDGFADLRRWNARKILYWYDAPADWSLQRPNQFKNRLRYGNVLAADDIFAVSAAQVRMAKTLRSGREKTVHYLPVGVDCAVFDLARVNRDEARRRLGFAPGDVVIGYLGYLGWWNKRFAGEVLLEAAPLLADANVRFLVIGSGPALEEWKMRARNLGLGNRFVFTDFVPQGELPSTISAADICVDTLEPGFHSEARSETKLKQYMAMARACVATNIGENRVDLDGGKAGVLVAPGPEPLAQGILDLCKNPDERSRLGNAARMRAETFYDWRLLAERMIGALRISLG